MTRPRVRCIAPVHLPADRLAWRAERYRALGLSAVVPLDVDLVNLPSSAPPALDTADAVEASIGAVRAIALSADPAEVDAVMPDCILDPGVEEGFAADLREPVPVLGMTRLVAHHLVASGRRFSAVTRNQAIADELARKLAEYGLAHAFTGTDVIDGSLELVSDHAEWNARLAAVVRGPRATAAGTVYNGCSAVDVDLAQDGGPLVVDPAPLALDLLSLALAPSRVSAT